MLVGNPEERRERWTIGIFQGVELGLGLRFRSEHWMEGKGWNQTSGMEHSPLRLTTTSRRQRDTFFMVNIWKWFWQTIHVSDEKARNRGYIHVLNPERLQTFLRLVYDIGFMFRKRNIYKMHKKVYSWFALSINHSWPVQRAQEKKKVSWGTAHSLPVNNKGTKGKQ